MKPSDKILKKFKKHCADLFSHYKLEAFKATALGNPNQPVLPHDILIFVEIFEEFGQEKGVQLKNLAKENPELEQELNNIAKLTTYEFALLGRQLTDRINES